MKKMVGSKVLQYIDWRHNTRNQFDLIDLQNTIVIQYQWLWNSSTLVIMCHG